MANEERSHGPATRIALRNLPTLKPDHQTLLRTLLADTGMAPASLETLVEHLLEEEGPELQQELVRAKAAAPGAHMPGATARGAAGDRPIATVGSLRPADGVPVAGRGTVGSLRR